ncbi:hypothetical protein ANN_22304 [Periplaneta americana]|uniref:Tc1-like transposase DDE domain-containing protein n=1 Tax=Periplaneta americana TaxID=6978 RepID=A0ABQ8S8P4_PERAM|nr:hypothetical protein ANN_22304 [Periplaneta americana]
MGGIEKRGIATYAHRRPRNQDELWDQVVDTWEDLAGDQNLFHNLGVSEVVLQTFRDDGEGHMYRSEIRNPGPEMALEQLCKEESPFASRLLGGASSSMKLVPFSAAGYNAHESFFFCSEEETIIIRYTPPTGFKDGFTRRCDVDPVDWPPNSPDMNPIQNLWAAVKRILRSNWAEEPPVRTPEELWDRVLDAWEEMAKNLDLFHNLVDSMPRRMRAVVDAGGLWTRY